ncbi:hypothetical protein [Marinobacterium iners]|uniref:Uncharacterized protein n=1 Tax=Marinobacterium iners DSM 11526 TaxID=1122198 RepID=A0A1H3X9U6_9GAMM|nr:hypothetical protein [Marinobacterium iners]SDZ95338.1 hypothetical protein SAMN02745729_10165 [Marinobacterium iners DSM 11526]
MSLIPTPEMVKPKVRGQSDFFSWQLYRYLRKYPYASQQRIWAGTWNSATGIDPESPQLYIGSERDGFWIHARQLRNLCCHNSGLERWAYGPGHDTRNWTDVTEAFWADYLKKGVCAIHGDFAHEWDEEGDRRTCLYCGQVEVKTIVMKPHTVWQLAPVNTRVEGLTGDIDDKRQRNSIICNEERA